MAGRTCIIVAHRLSTAIRSECILVLRQGRILEDGSHRELMLNQRFYYDMMSMDKLDQQEKSGSCQSHCNLH